MTTLKVGGLFAGYGGLDLAVCSVLDAEPVWFSEFDKGPSAILAHRFPGVPNHGDITKIDWSQVEPVDILTGGSPCQDLSHAGKRAGMTDGTRSNLWVAMREAIAELRPQYVIWENVRGAYSAAADSDLEPCAGCVGDGSGVHLRALGRVLGDLAELGYDARWHGLRAADVGAPHGRFRVFIVATNSRGLRRGEGWATVAGEAPGRGASADIAGRGDSSVKCLPTPTTRDHKDHTIRREPHRPNDVDTLARALTDVPCALLPTPAVNDMGEGKTVEKWDDWTATMQAKHGNGNGHGKSLAIEAQRLLPTPSVADALGGHERRGGARGDELLLNGVAKEIANVSAAEGRSGEVLRGVRDSDVPQEVRGEARGQDALPVSQDLLSELREQSRGSRQGYAPLAGQEAQGVGLPRLRHDEAAARSPRGQEPGEQRPGEPDDALRELSPQVALAGGQGEAAGRESLVDWGEYGPAIRRWELTLGRRSPMPTQLSTKGNPQLSPKFVEFLMGLPAGWVTDVPGITRNQALKALGNGVCPQQAAAALREMFAWEVAA